MNSNTEHNLEEAEIRNLSDSEVERMLEGTEEVMGPGNSVESVDSLFDNNDAPSAYVGFEPSGLPHLGHLITFQKLNDLAEIGFDPKILLADRHAYLNEKPKGVPQENARDEIESYSNAYQSIFQDLISNNEHFSGLENTEFIRAFDMHQEDGFMGIDDDLSRIIPEHKAKQATGEITSEENGNTLKQGQTEYPVLQVADMYHMGVDVAVGGIDQRKIHSLARDFVPVGFDENDKPIAIHTPLIGTNIGEGDKMSSSSGTALSLDSSPDEIYDAVNQMNLFRSKDAISDRYGEQAVEGIGEDEAIYLASDALQLANHFPLRHEGTLQWQQPEEYGGEEFEYEDIDTLVEDVREGRAHPMDVKEAISEYLTDMLEPVRTTDYSG